MGDVIGSAVTTLGKAAASWPDPKKVDMIMSVVLRLKKEQNYEAKSIQ
jgi:hypothetical protein